MEAAEAMREEAFMAVVGFMAVAVSTGLAVSQVEGFTPADFTRADLLTPVVSPLTQGTSPPGLVVLPPDLVVLPPDLAVLPPGLAVSLPAGQLRWPRRQLRWPNGQLRRSVWQPRWPTCMG